MVHTLPEVREAAARHPKAPAVVLDQLAGDAETGVLYSVAENSATGPETLARLAECDVPYVRDAVARSPRAPVDVLARLVRAGSAPDLREATPHRAPLDPADRDALLRGGPYARALVASHREAPADTLERLSGDVRTVRRAVASNPGAPAALLERLAADPEYDVRGAVAANTAAPLAVLERLANDHDASIAAAAAANRCTPLAVLERLAETRKESIQQGLLANPAAPRALLEAVLANAVDARVADGLGDNPAAPLDLLVRYPKSFKAYLKAARGRRLAEAEIVQTLAGSTGFEARCWAAEQPDAPPGVLTALARDASWKVRETLAKRSDAEPSLLAALAHDARVEVRRRVARHPNAPADLLHQLQRDADRTVRSHANRRHRTDGLSAATPPSSGSTRRSR